MSVFLIIIRITVSINRFPIAISSSDEGCLLRTVKEKLIAIVTTDSEINKMLKDIISSDAFTESSQTIWATNADASDIDSKRTAFN